MKLTSAFRKAVLSYERPTLAWKRPQDCTVSQGETVVISARRSSTTGGRDQGEDWRRHYEPLMHDAEVLETPVVAVTITELRRTRTGGVTARYRVRDDRAEFMARGLAKDGRTTNRDRSIDPDAERPERDFENRLSAEASLRDSAIRAHKRRQAEVLRTEGKLNRTRSKPPRTRRVLRWQANGVRRSPVLSA